MIARAHLSPGSTDATHTRRAGANIRRRSHRQGAALPCNTSVTLGDPVLRFGNQRPAEGRHGAASDAAPAGLRSPEAREARPDALRAALIEGEESGPARPVDRDAVLARLRGT